MLFDTGLVCPEDRVFHYEIRPPDRYGRVEAPFVPILPLLCL